MAQYFCVQGRVNVEENFIGIAKSHISDSGAYVCMVENLFGSSNKTFNLVVRVRLLLSHKDFFTNHEYF